MAYQRTFSGPLRYANLDEVDVQADRNVLPEAKGPKKAQLRKCAKSLAKVDDELYKALLGNDEELAYIYAMRYMSLFQVMYKSREFLDDDTWFANNKIPPTDAIRWAETLKDNLKKRYEEQEKKTQPVPTQIPMENGKALREISNIDGSKRSKATGASDSSNGHDAISEDSDKTEISVTELNAFLNNKNEKTILVMDIRDAGLYQTCHVVCRNVLNIPGERLCNIPFVRLNVSTIEEILDDGFLSLWRERHTFDVVVIVDKEGHMSEMVRHLIAVMTEYSSDPVKRNPLLLQGGFYGLIHRYPYLTSDPHHKMPITRAAKQTINDIRYPSRSIFSDVSPVSPDIPRKALERSQSPSQNGLDRRTLTDQITERPEGFRRSPSGVDLFPEPSGYAFPAASFQAGIDEPRDSSRRQASTTVPVANRLTKPSVTSTIGEGISLPASKSENSFDSVVNNPNVTTRRGSGTEFKGESSDEELKKPTASRLAPTIPRAVKPAVFSKPSNDRIAPVDSLSEVVTKPVSTSPSTTRSASPQNGVTFKSSQDGYSKTLPLQPVMPLPPKRPLTAKPSLDSGSEPYQANGPKILNIPIVIEPRDAVQPDPKPEVQRALKPTGNIPAASPQRSLPRPPHPSLLEPSAHTGPNRTIPGCTGLVNTGNSCYMNSVLQCLAHTASIRDYYRTGAYRKYINFDNRRGTGGKISVYMEELIKNLWSGTFAYFTPRFMKECLAENYKLFRGSDQQDGGEALGHILDLLHRDTNQAELVNVDSATCAKRLKIENAENLPPQRLADETDARFRLLADSIINNHFTFLQESVLKCGTCGHESCSFTNDQMLLLTLGEESLQSHPIDLMELMAQSMQAEGYNAEVDWTCPKCKRLRSATQRYYLNKLPRILVVQLKRFLNDGADVWKNARRVRFSHTISLAPFCNRPEIAKKAQYRLYALVDHVGALDTGHYTARVLHCDNRKDWLHCNDQVVNRIPDPKNVPTESAFLLFYEQMYF